MLGTVLNKVERNKDSQNKTGNEFLIGRQTIIKDEITSDIHRLITITISLRRKRENQIEDKNVLKNHENLFKK